jgi:hypothetical protein
MGYAEKIYEQVKRLPEHAAKEVFDFAEFVAVRRAGNTPPASQTEREHRRFEVEQTFAKYQVDLSNFKFSREEANARC